MERRIAAIEHRNRRVELDKAWETSAVRRMIIFVSTYLVLGLYLWAIAVPRPWLNAIVPAVGFMLSTFVLAPARRRWERRRGR
ncbi:hypothetical protein HY634_02865 [Candidatus Uhrbacteria bacterium]|nr:hypothetical protein [Candidatus Uhrbacteria bacterium]